MNKTCLVCSLVNEPQFLSNNQSSESKYYIVCDQGHILCGTCTSSQHRDICQKEISHPTYPKQNYIECLRHNKGSSIYNKIKSKCFQQEKYVDMKQEQLNQLTGINNSRAYLHIQSEGPFIIIDQQPTEQLQTKINLLKEQIKRYQGNSLRIKLYFDIFAAVISFLTTIFITAGVILATFQDKSVGTYILIFMYLLLLVAFQYPFFAIIIPQTTQRCKKSILILALMIVCMFLCNGIYLSIAISASIPINTLEIIQNKPIDWLFWIPKTFPFSWKINHAVNLCKTAIFWLMVISGSLFQNVSFTIFTFLLSLLEAFCLIYLNLRYNSNLPLLKRIYEKVK